MTTDQPLGDFATSVDTSVVRIMTGEHSGDPDYLRLIGNTELRLTYFADAELGAVQWDDGERQRFVQLRPRLPELPPPGLDTKRWFVEAATARRHLQFSQAQRDHTDLWIIAQSAEHRLRLASHDRQMIRVADAMGVEIVTLLPDIEQQLSIDRQRLASQPRG